MSLEEDYVITFEQADAGAVVQFQPKTTIDTLTLPARQLDPAETFTNPPGKRNPWEPDGS